MLYDGARRFLRQAGTAMREGEVERAHNTLRRAELIIGHLDGTLDHEQGSDLPAPARDLPVLPARTSTEGAWTRTPRMLEEVSDLLGELREAWAEMARG